MHKGWGWLGPKGSNSTSKDLMAHMVDLKVALRADTEVEDMAISSRMVDTMLMGNSNNTVYILMGTWAMLAPSILDISVRLKIINLTINVISIRSSKTVGKECMTISHHSSSSNSSNRARNNTNNNNSSKT